MADSVEKLPDQDFSEDVRGPLTLTYGRLAYDGEELRVLYRTTDEDLQDEAHGISEDERSYHSKPLSSSSPKWLDRLLAAASVDSLFASISTVLDERETQVDQSLGALDKLLAAESAEIEAQIRPLLPVFGLDDCINLIKGIETNGQTWGRRGAYNDHRELRARALAIDPTFNSAQYAVFNQHLD